MRMRLWALCVGLVLMVGAQPVCGATVSAVFGAQVEEDEIDAFSGNVDQAFFNVQGDDDQFTVYSLVDFDSSQLGLTGLSTGQVASISLGLTQSNAGFSTNGGLEFFLASDTRAITLSDTARYLSDGDNVGAEVVGSSFGTLYSLGTAVFTQTNTGDVDDFSLSLDTVGEQFLVDQINSGGILRVIGTPTDLGVAATYSGANSLLDPPSPPTLTITAIPEPNFALALGVGCCIIGCKRRRRR